MANYATLKAAVQAVVKTNGNKEITGANLQTVLLSIINSVGGGGYLFKGVATPSTDAGTPDENVFYIGAAGTYANFGSSITIPVGSIGVFKYNGFWTRETLKMFEGIDETPTAASTNLVQSGGVKQELNNIGYYSTNTYTKVNNADYIPLGITLLPNEQLRIVIENSNMTNNGGYYITTPSKSIITLVSRTNVDYIYTNETSNPVAIGYFYVIWGDGTTATVTFISGSKLLELDVRTLESSVSNISDTLIDINGDIEDINADLSLINKDMYGYTGYNYVSGYIDSYGVVQSSDDYCISDFIEVNGNNGFTWYYGSSVLSNIRAQMYNADKEPLQGITTGAVGLLAADTSTVSRNFSKNTLSQNYDTNSIKYIKISFKNGYTGKLVDMTTHEDIYIASYVEHAGVVADMENKVSYSDGNREYLGERLVLDVAHERGNKCDVELVYSVLYGDGTDHIYLHQSCAIYNNIMFSFRDEAITASVDLIDISTWTRLGTIEMADGYASHKNNAQFTNVFYDVDDTFPLLILSRGDYGVTHPEKPYNDFYVYRVLVNNGVYSLQLVKTISASTTDIPETKYNGSWFVDSNQNRLFLYTLTIAQWNDTTLRSKNRGLIYEFKMPDLIDPNVTTLTGASIVNKSTTKFHIWQGACGYNGKMFAPVGYGVIGKLSDYNEPLNTSVLVFNEDSFSVSNVLPWCISYEPEGCAIWNDALYVCFHHSNNASSGDICFGVYKYTFK